MADGAREDWRELCEKAAQEKDPTKLMELVSKINAILQQKEGRLQRESDETGS